MKNRGYLTVMTIVAASLTMILSGSNALASGRNLCYEVTVTNLTAAQVFTPVVAAVHRKGVNLFTIGEAVKEELAVLAESGETGPLVDLLESKPGRVGAVAVSKGGPFLPGESVVVNLPASKRFNRLSLASMLALTNDGFVALNSVPARTSLSYAPVYDAGSEINDELTANIPGTGGEGFNADGGEGFAHIHNGIHGIGDLPDYSRLDWRNPAARVTSRLIGCSTETY